MTALGALLAWGLWLALTGRWLRVQRERRGE